MSSLTCRPQTARTWMQSITLFVMPFNRCSINVDDLWRSTSWIRRSSLSEENCRSVSLIAPYWSVHGIAGLSASSSSSSKAHTLNIWCNKKLCYRKDDSASIVHSSFSSVSALFSATYGLDTRSCANAIPHSWQRSAVGLLEKNLRNRQCLFCGIWMRVHSIFTDSIQTASFVRSRVYSNSR